MHEPKFNLLDLTEKYDEEHEPYDYEMPFGGIIEISDVIKQAFVFLKIDDERIYPKPKIDRMIICEVIREMVYAEMVKSAEWAPRGLLKSIDQYQAAYDS